MIPLLISRFTAATPAIRAGFAAKRPGSYRDIVLAVVNAVTDDDYGELAMDPARIQKIDDGDYQGTELYVVAAKGYQPSDYWAVKVAYGSCSGCDALQAIHDYGDEAVTDTQLDDYMTLALHIAQGFMALQDR